MGWHIDTKIKQSSLDEDGASKGEVGVLGSSTTDSLTLTQGDHKIQLDLYQIEKLADTLNAIGL